MILILTDQDEPTTDLIVDWLYKFKKSFIRISKNTSIKIISIYFKDKNLEAIFSVKDDFVDEKIDTKDIDSYWYRRSYLQLSMPELLPTDNSSYYKAVHDFIWDEYKTCHEILDHILSRKAKINKYKDNLINKLIVLEKAHELGLKIPKTIICSEKKQLQLFFKDCKNNVITKSIGDPTSFYNLNYHQYTTKIDYSDLSKTFALSLFQEMIDKSFELRVFVINSEFYGTAIFSQSDEQTKIDLKNYNLIKPNRVIPFNLPKNEKQLIMKLMKCLELKSGSIDIAINKDYEFIFLEINPIGQFEQVSFPGNYNLFKKIAEIL